MRKKFLIGFMALGSGATLMWALREGPVDRPLSLQGRVASADRLLSSEKSGLSNANPVEKNKNENLEKIVSPGLAPEVLENLQFFQELTLKPLLSAEEERRKKELLWDRELIQSLGRALVDPKTLAKSSFEATQNSALDLLIAALQEGDQESSLQAIQSVIRDGQVESSQLPIALREMMAGIKGELMFQAVPLAPQAFSDLTSTLPGPVSLKIWQNVQIQHQQNIRESQVEVEAYQSQAKNRR